MKRCETRLIHKLLHSNPPGLYFINLTDEEVDALAAERQEQQMNGETIPPYIPHREPALHAPPPIILSTSEPTPVAPKRKRAPPANVPTRVVNDGEEMANVDGEEMDQEMDDGEPALGSDPTVGFDPAVADSSSTGPSIDPRGPSVAEVARSLVNARAPSSQVISSQVASPHVVAPQVVAPSTPTTSSATTAATIAMDSTSAIEPPAFVITAAAPSLPNRLPTTASHDQSAVGPSSPSRHVAVACNKENIASTTSSSPVQPHTSSTSVLQPAAISNAASTVATDAPSPKLKPRSRVPPSRFKDNGTDDVPPTSDVEQAEDADEDDDDDDQPARKKRRKQAPAATKPKAKKTPAVAGPSKVKASKTVSAAAVKKAMASTKAKKAKTAAA